MDGGDNRALIALQRSAMVTRAFGIDNPAFAGGPEGLATLLERFFLLVVAIEHLEGQRARTAHGHVADARRP